MRVLHIYSGNLYGGVERMLATLAAGSGAAAMEPHFALCFDGRLAEELRAVGAPVHMLGAVRMRRPGSVLGARRQLAALLHGGGFDVAICHAPWSHALFGGVVRRAAVPLVFFLHDRADGRHWTERLARRRKPDLAICNSRYTSGTLDRLYPGVPRDVLHCPVPRAVDARDRGATRAALGATPQQVVIIQVARMEPWKGQLELIDALTRLPPALPWTCWIVGGAQRQAESAYRQQVEAAAAARGIAARLALLGERTDVADLLRAADIFCHPARHPEPFGIAVVEALWAGVPVVTFDAGGPAEVVDASCGVLVRPSDEAGLAAALALLIGNAELRQRLGGAGPARAAAVADPAVQAPRLRAMLEGVTRSAA
jgi:glycosyltransferase involved in cell wall biosynthesis